jgi:hypothetical protein
MDAWEEIAAGKTRFHNDKFYNFAVFERNVK